MVTRLMRNLAIAIAFAANALPLWSATIEGTVSLSSELKREKPVPYNRGVYRSSAKPLTTDVVIYLENPPPASEATSGRAVMR